MMKKFQKLFCSLVFGGAALLLSVNSQAQYNAQTYNGVYTWLPQGVYNSTQNSPDNSISTARGIIAICNITSVTALQTVQLVLEGKEYGLYWNVASTTPTGVTGMIFLRVSPSYNTVAPTLGGVTSNDYLPYTWRIRMVHSGSGNFTYSCNYSLLAV